MKTIGCNILVATALAMLLPCPAPACSLCQPNIKSQRTLRQDVKFAKLVLFGYAVELDQPSAKGKGRTEFHIKKIVKYDPFLGKKQKIVLNRYIPVLDPKNPPHFLVFCDIFDGKLDPYAGRSVRTDAVMKYLDAAKAIEKKDRVDQLLFFFDHLSNPDKTISHDAFLEFAKADDKYVAAAGKKLSPGVLRKLLADPKLEPERISLYAYLLGSCGEPQDAALLKTMLESSSRRYRDALNGIYAGYIALRPKEGWKLALTMLSDEKKSFSQRYGVLQAIRFFHESNPKESRPHVVRGLESLVVDGMMADLGVEHLRKWKIWDLTDTVLAQFGKKSHSSPIVKRAIVRYALCCPLPQAQRFVKTVEQAQPNLIRELRESIELEKK